VAQKLGNSEIPTGEAVDLDEMIAKETEKYIKQLEKAVEHEPEYAEFKPLIEQDPEKKMKLLQNIALKYNKNPDVLSKSGLELPDYTTYTSKHKSAMDTRGWSEVRSSNSQGISSSVRHSRYKAMGFDPSNKDDYFRNLKIIKKLQGEKKQREKVMKYIHTQEIIKQQSEEEKRQQLEKQKKQMHEKEVEEWKERYGWHLNILDIG
jgi:hypothetical protein